MLKWMLFNPEYIFIHLQELHEHIFMSFNLKIVLAFSERNTHIVNTVQFKILNRKCSFLIQLYPIKSNWIQLNPIASN